ncbi:hypothetical protein NYZ02_19105, partial [Acinetobacter baumannii]|nr:hypothetical protein [Acinetobacter baumannii]
IYRIRQTSYPSCNLNFSNLGKLYLQRLYATKPVRSKEFLQCGDRIKKIIDEFKVHLVDVKHKNEKPNLEKYMNEYRKVLDGFENHDDVDYKSAFYEYENKRYIALSEDDKSKWDCSKFCVST